MAVIAKVKAGARLLADSAVAYTALACLTPVLTTSAVIIGSLYYFEMKLIGQLEKAFADVLACTQGVESEQNWTQRQSSILEVRKLTNNTLITQKLSSQYVTGTRAISDGIVKAVQSLRTTLSGPACGLIADIARAVGPSLDPALVDKLLTPVITLCGHTKSLNREHGDAAVIAIVTHIPIVHRILQNITATANCQNHLTRTYTASWLKIIIEKNGRHCEPHGGLDLIDRCIRTGLRDAKLEVREPMRDTYWTFARIWPDRAESIMSSLESRQQQMLDSHPNKPHGIISPQVNTDTTTAATTTTATRATIATPTLTTTTSQSTVTPGPARPSIKEIKLAAMRARKAEKAATPAPEEIVQDVIPPRTTKFLVSAGGPSRVPSQSSTLSAPPRRPGRAPVMDLTVAPEVVAPTTVALTSVALEVAVPEVDAPEVAVPEVDAPEVVAPTTVAPAAVATVPLPVPQIHLPLNQRDPQTMVALRSNSDKATHLHTWHNKETAERRRSISPRSKDPEEARKILAQAILQIKSRSIDDHGYRKVQGLITYHDSIFTDEEKYDEMLLALLDALETPNTETRAPLGRRLDNKFQLLVTIRLMFVHNRKYFAAYYPRAMSALIIARRNFQSRNHIVSGLEETAKDIAAVCLPPDVIDAVIDVLETEENDALGIRTVAMGLHILAALTARMRTLQASFDPQQEQRVAAFGYKCLRQSTSIVRRATIQYCMELRHHVKPEKRYFRLVTGNRAELKNLITYYANTNEHP